MSVVSFYYRGVEAGGANVDDMANLSSTSHSPGFQNNTRPFAPATPIHSAQHSLASSISSRTRTPLQPLTIHQFRKQQSSPAPQTATPPGKTLRRRAATPTLAGVDRIPTASHTPVAKARPAPLLHFSRSAHQLHFHPPTPPTPSDAHQRTSLLADSLRSQSAEPRDSGGVKLGAFGTINPKVSAWKPIKRLPKPSHPFPIPLSPAPTIPLTQAKSLSPLPSKSYSSTDNRLSPETDTNSSNFSLSRFPQPPLLIDPPLSPPNDENEPLRLNTSFTTTAPVTPPATPAVIHYRGTSFDLINPHDSLLYRDIVTPSRDLDSTDYLPLRSSEEDLDSSDLTMAQRGRFFKDFSSAHHKITRREDELPETADLEPPSPALISPESSYFSSPEQGLGSHPRFGASPLTLRKSGTESRFSLKQLTPLRSLTRNFTKRLGKSPEIPQGEELQEFPSSLPQVATPTLEGRFPRSLHDSYRTAIENPIIEGPYDLQVGSTYTDMPSPEAGQHFRPSQLSSMVPDSSVEMGRVDEPGASNTDEQHYDRMSVYASSSVYTGEGEATRGCPPSLYNPRDSRRISRPAIGLSYEDEATYPSGYPRLSKLSNMYSPMRSSRRTSFPFNLSFRQSQVSGNDHTDTIGQFIEQYNEDEDNIAAQEGDYARQSPANREVGQFNFGLDEEDRDDETDPEDESLIVRPLRHGLPLQHDPPVQPGAAHMATINRIPGSPPDSAVPLAPAFEYDYMSRPAQQPSASEFVSASSYGETRHLLRLSQPMSAELVGPARSILPSPLKPSSSYSQPTDQTEARTPQEALDHAEEIFSDAIATQESLNRDGGFRESVTSQEALDHADRIFNQSTTSEEALDHADRIFSFAGSADNDNEIPAMWSRRGSGNLMRNRNSAYENMEEYEDDEGDWETIRQEYRHKRMSLGSSIADYSSSESNKSHLGFPRSSLPDSVLQTAQRQPVSDQHARESPPYSNPFSSSPPAFATRGTMHSAPEEQHSSLMSSSAPYSSTVPYLRQSSGDAPREFVRELSPWDTGVYGMSEKETRELLASGPNEDIDVESNGGRRRLSTSMRGSRVMDSVSSDRESALEQLTGTDVRVVESDTSSPRAPWRSGMPDYYANPYSSEGFYQESSRRSSITPIRQSQPTDPAAHERSPSQVTLFPSHYRLPSLPKSQPPGRGRRMSARKSRAASVQGRSAVAGQTRLREMMLASDARTASSRQSHLYDDGNSERPSTSKTNTPLRGLPVHHSVSSLRTGPVASHTSPALLCPERVTSPEEEAERSKISWILFAAFCVFPPAIILYRFFGDYVITQLTKGRFGHCSTRPKRIATFVGFMLNIGSLFFVVVPILVMHGLGLL
ncbi:hypothetical protein B0J11DRAFT_16793 [Dendryphion nanum]|uniref:Uncharacterized protein n=1 Tax=Dendryphion nanum TaxID=256645 RepID=A0A9P9IWR2_9PLEO|nr:hypothetical protein B0J11DRAFT_16793 [Dendryphion nanum]